MANTRFGSSCRRAAVSCRLSRRLLDSTSNGPLFSCSLYSQRVSALSNPYLFSSYLPYFPPSIRVSYFLSILHSTLSATVTLHSHSYDNTLSLTKFSFISTQCISNPSSPPPRSSSTPRPSPLPQPPITTIIMEAEITPTQEGARV